MKLQPAYNLACPICGSPLQHPGDRLVCDSNHSFDRARQGYVNLLPVQHKKSRHPGDSKAMVQARSAFLDRGHYRPIADALVETVVGYIPTSGHRSIVDAGCGEGYYLERLIRDLTAEASDEAGDVSAIGLDISREAIVAATRRYRDLQWIVGTNIHPPVQPGSVDVLLCLFGFPSFKHFAPLLKPEGVIVLADPGPDHLIELRQLIYPSVRRSAPQDLAAALGQGLEQIGSKNVQYGISRMPRNDLQNLLAMTPHLHKASHEGKQALARLEQLSLTVDIAIRVLAKRDTQ